MVTAHPTYIVGTEDSEAHRLVHVRTDPAYPTTVCGLSFLGVRATQHAIITGGAIECVPCKTWWDAR
jgi:hypothetical protein